MFSAIATGMPTDSVALVMQSIAFFYHHNFSSFYYVNQWFAITMAFVDLMLIAFGQQHSLVPFMESVNPIGLVVWGNFLHL